MSSPRTGTAKPPSRELAPHSTSLGSCIVAAEEFLETAHRPRFGFGKPQNSVLLLHSTNLDSCSGRGEGV